MDTHARQQFRMFCDVVYDAGFQGQCLALLVLVGSAWLGGSVWRLGSWIGGDGVGSEAVVLKSVPTAILSATRCFSVITVWVEPTSRDRSSLGHSTGDGVCKRRGMRLGECLRGEAHTGYSLAI